MVVLDEHFVLVKEDINNRQDGVRRLLLLSVYQYYETP